MTCPASFSENSSDLSISHCFSIGDRQKNLKDFFAEGRRSNEERRSEIRNHSAEILIQPFFSFKKDRQLPGLFCCDLCRIGNSRSSGNSRGSRSIFLPVKPKTSEGIAVTGHSDPAKRGCVVIIKIRMHVFNPAADRNRSWFHLTAGRNRSSCRPCAESCSQYRKRAPHPLYRRNSGIPYLR